MYNRPFDDQTQPRVWLETLAFSVILQMIEDGSVALVTSTVVSYENSLYPDNIARTWVARCLALAQGNQLVDGQIRRQAEILEREGFTALDALHIACAEAANCDYLITCDDRLVKRYRRQGHVLRVCTPMEFVELEATGGE